MERRPVNIDSFLGRCLAKSMAGQWPLDQTVSFSDFIAAVAKLVTEAGVHGYQLRCDHSMLSEQEIEAHFLDLVYKSPLSGR